MNYPPVIAWEDPPAMGEPALVTELREHPKRWAFLAEVYTEETTPDWVLALEAMPDIEVYRHAVRERGLLGRYYRVYARYVGDA